MENSKKVSSALSELMSLTETVGDTATLTQENAQGLEDPVIRTAQRNKATVTLGVDPNFKEVAKEAAVLNASLKTLKTSFEKLQAKIREYGSNKRTSYNRVFHSDVVTVNIPYEAVNDKNEVAFKQIQVICSSRYNVAKEAILKLEKELGDKFSKLFVKDTKKVLKANSEDLFKQILLDLGVPENKIASTMSILFDEDVTVNTTENYEKELQSLTSDLKLILNQNVIRSQPGIKFVD